jgi:hypothetical protein
MKHIAIRSLSIQRNAPYTAPGLGDRLYTMLFAYNYSIEHNTPVTIHLTSDKYFRPDKNASWKEIHSLLPENTVYIEGHDIKELSEVEWIRYLQSKNISAVGYHNSDFPGPFEYPNNLNNMVDASKYIKKYYPLQPIVSDIELPEKFVTAQFDSNNVPYWKDSPDSRKIKPMDVERIFSQYRSQGYEIVIIGGDAQNPKLGGPGNLKNIGYAMSKADYHIGADSAFFHFAQFYMEANRIRLYYNKGGHLSHHSKRGQVKGAKLIAL